MPCSIRSLDPARHATQCDAIIKGLPYFFGQADGIRACAEAVRAQRGWVAEGGGRVTGFLTIGAPLRARSEITWMAVERSHRRQGLGRLLVERAALELTLEAVEAVSVGTLGPSTAEPGVQDGYEGTRRFYRAVDFVPVREVAHLGCPS